MQISRRRPAVLASTVRSAGFAFAVVLAWQGCGDSVDARRPSRVSAKVSDQIATVVIVSWTTDVSVAGYVEYGPTRQLGARTPVEATAASAHTMTLLGLTADTDYFYRVVSWDSGDVATSDIATIHTGNLPLGLPDLTHTGDGFEGFIVVPILGATTAVTIINSKGQIVWYHTDERQLDFYRARLSVDGASLLYNAAKISGEPSPASELVRVSLDGSQSSSIPIPYLAHDFVEHPDGTLAAIAFEDRMDTDGTTRIRGNKLVEVATNGTQRTVWTSWNCFDYATLKGDDPQQGWTFSNALDYDPGEDVYYVGMRNFSSIAKVNRTSGACEWVLGLYGSTFTFAAGSERFLHEHQFDVQGNRILVMDNDGAPGDESRVLEYDLDLTTMVATEVWSYMANPSVYTFVLGEPIRLSDGGTFVNWSTAGQMERLDATGASIWKLNSGAGVAFGFQTLAGSLYQAPTP